MVVEGDDQTLEQMSKQLDKLVNVLQVLDLTQRPAVERELMLLKVWQPLNTAAPCLISFRSSGPRLWMWLMKHSPWKWWATPENWSPSNG